ncbi:unnamed protein product [Ceratitis capitata]|uniref:tRNA-dihydrouridine(47) synthase [NAD(P)(+)] n=1 Tax=Ceratitis capitata TaxID=7213 RepID=A0A811UD53_CERCA|nr:unnamed protein product [Ceratitis capitata]
MTPRYLVPENRKPTISAESAEQDNKRKSAEQNDNEVGKAQKYQKTSKKDDIVHAEVTCRFAKAHLDADGRNIKSSDYDENKARTKLQVRLRKSEYDFTLCKELVNKADKLRDERKKKLDNGADKPKMRAIQLTLKMLLKKRQYGGRDAARKPPVDFTEKLILSPLTTEFGADITCGEMACAVPIVKGLTQEWALTKRHISEDVFGVQICGVYADKSVAHELLPLVEEWGAAAVTLHGRSREQRYTKSANWQYIEECAAKAKHMPDSERFELLRKYVNYGLEHWGSDTKCENTRRFLLEWQSFLYRYIPYELLAQPPQQIINDRKSFVVVMK